MAKISAVLTNEHDGQLPGGPTSKAIGPHDNLCMLCTAWFFGMFKKITPLLEVPIQ